MPKAEPQKKPTRQTQGENWSRWPRCCQRTLRHEPNHRIMMAREFYRFRVCRGLGFRPNGVERPR